MHVIIRCPNASCGQRLRLPRDFASARCPRCRVIVNKPAAAPEPLPARAATTDRSMSFGQLPREVALQLEDVCCRFEGDWTAGRRPRLEEYLGSADVPEHQILVQELILLDMHYRRQAGEVLRAGDYAGRFPGLEAAWLAEHVEEAAAVGPEPGPARATDPYETQPPIQPDETVPPDPQGSAAGSQAFFPGYEILGTLGRGGMGVVYKARDLKLKRVVALKMILAGAHAGERELGRFKAEAEAIARLQHPNIVQIHEVGEHDGLPFISLEYCTGGSLDRKLAGTPLPPREGAKVVATLARAMHAAHEARVVHRDLKPANVLLTADGTPKITDFGLAKKLDDVGQTQSGAIMGTPSYMAPEQAGGKTKDLGPSADIYALGAILYELLTGRPPFKAATPLDTVLQVVSDEPVPPTQLQSRTPRDLETICLKCLRKEPAKRYASAAALADELERYLRGEPILARPVGRGERVVKWVKRNPAVSALLTAIFLLLVGGSTAIYVKYEDAKDQQGEAIKQAQIANTAVGSKDTALKKLEYTLALDQILLGKAAFDSGNVAVAHERLDQVPADLRQWEWHFLKRQCQGGIFTLYGHSDAVRSVAFSPDGTRIVTGSYDKTAKVWDARTGMLLLELKGHKKQVSSVAFSPDGTRIVTGSWDNTAKVWDALTGTPLLDLKGHAKAVHSVAFSPDGTRLATGSWDKTAKIWDARTGRPLLDLNGHTDRVYSVAFSPDGTRLATGSSDKTAKVWDALTGTPLLELKWHADWVLKGHFDRVVSVVFSPDGKRLATGSWDMTAKVWDARTGMPLLELKGHNSRLWSVVFSPDGKRLATGGWDKTAKVWDSRTGTLLLELKGHTKALLSVAFSPDGMRLATSSGDKTGKVWDARTGTPLLELKGNTNWVFSVAFSPDGTRLATQGLEQHLNHVAFSPDGTALATGSSYNSAKVWDARTGKPLRELKGHTSNVMSVAFSPDGARLVTGSDDQTAKVWDTRTGTALLELKGHTMPVYSVTFSPDGTRLVTGSGDSTAKVWDARAGTPVLELKGHAKAVYSVAFSPDGTRLATGSLDKTAKIWDVRTDKPVLELKGHTDNVMCVAFSPDGTRLVTGSADQTAKVWDTRTGTVVLELKGHTMPVSSVAFSPDGTRLVTGSWDGTAKVWELRIGTPLLELKWHTNVLRSVAFSPDGTRLVTGSQDGTAKIWDATSRGQREDQVLPPEESEYRLFWTRPRPDLHWEEHDKAVQAKDGFAANFHLDRLLGFYKQAVALDPKDAQSHVEMGKVLHEKKDLAGAIAEYRRAIGLDPKLIVAHKKLAAAFADNNDWDGAIAVYRQTLALDPKDTEVRVILFLKEQYQPKDNAERLELEEHCYLQQQYLAAARLITDAFAADPKLADDINGWRRNNAAYVAALAGSGQGKDAKELDNKERTRWRMQALDWLRADLAAHEKQLESGKPEARSFAQERLRHWQAEVAFAGIRDQEALAKQPAEERAACQKLWADVETLLQKVQAKTK